VYTKMAEMQHFCHACIMGPQLEVIE